MFKKTMIMGILLINAMHSLHAMKCDDENQKKLNTELISAVFHDCPEKITQAILRGAEVNHRASQFGDTPLMIAILLGKSNAISTLLLWQANVLVRNNNGETALHYALPGRSDLALIRVLLERKADIYAKNIFGIMPIDRLDGATRHAVFTLHHDLCAPQAQPSALPDFYLISLIIPFNPFNV